jgi:glutamate-ammonia-ligase adenylyltransferase
MTGAGVAYSVDARLRPSGGQGMLVTSLDAFEAYQRDDAQTWEHVAMLRARPIAGDLAGTRAVLERVRAEVRGGHPCPWPELAEMRARIEAERAAPEGALSLKTGPGGTLDVDFLAGGAMLERGSVAMPALPSVPALLRAACGAAAEPLIAAYSWLRRAEASARWAAGRAVEAIASDGFGPVAELCEPGLGADDFRSRLEAARRDVRAAYDRVIAAGSVGALGQ